MKTLNTLTNKRMPEPTRRNHNMIKVIVNYDIGVTNNLTDDSGVFLGTYVNLVAKEATEEKSKSLSVDDVCDLKKAGFTVDEITRIHSKGVV